MHIYIFFSLQTPLVVDRTLRFGSVRRFFGHFCSVRGQFGSVVFFHVRFGKKFGSAGFSIVRFGVLPNRIRTKTEQNSTPPDPLRPAQNLPTRGTIRKNDVCGRLAQFMSFRFSPKSRVYRSGRLSVLGGRASLSWGSIDLMKPQTT